MGTAARACSFGAGTVVLTADGERVPIEDIAVGDGVVATDPQTGERVIRTVVGSWSHVDQTVTISIDDRELVTTEDHRFWSQTAGAFVPAGDLVVGDKVVGDRGRVHTYHVGDADTLVHNTCDREVADAIPHGHAYAKHVLTGEFDEVKLDLYRKSDFADHIYEVMQRGVARPLPRERTGFLLDETVVVRNPLAYD